MKNTLSGIVKNFSDTVALVTDSASTALETSVVSAKAQVEKAGNSVVELGKSAGEVATDAAHATSKFASKAAVSVSPGAVASIAVIKKGVGLVGETGSAGVKAAASASSVVVNSAADTISALGVLVGDLNGDGKVDLEDAKIAAAKVKQVAGAAASELRELGKSALQSQLVKDTTAGAVVGGVLASMIPIPIVSTVTGATVGGVIGAYKSIGKK